MGVEQGDGVIAAVAGGRLLLAKAFAESVGAKEARTNWWLPDMNGVKRFSIVSVGGDRVKDEERERSDRFDALFEAHHSDVVAYCRWRAGSTSDAQDAVAEVFLTAWRRLDDVPRGDAARVWLYATARRVLANQRHRARARPLIRPGDESIERQWTCREWSRTRRVCQTRQRSS